MIEFIRIVDTDEWVHVVRVVDIDNMCIAPDKQVATIDTDAGEGELEVTRAEFERITDELTGKLFPAPPETDETEDEPGEPRVLKYWPQLAPHKGEYSWLEVKRDTYLSVWNGRFNDKGAPFMVMPRHGGTTKATFIDEKRREYSVLVVRQPSKNGVPQKLEIGKSILVYAKKFQGDGNAYYELVTPPGHYIPERDVIASSERLTAEEIK